MRALALVPMVAACASAPVAETRVGPGLQSDEPAANAAFSEDPRQLRFAPLEFDPPRAKVHGASGDGLKAFHLHDPELPLLHLALILGVGSKDDPTDRPGVAELLERVLPVGGAGDRPPAAFADAAESRAIDVRVSVAADHTQIRVSSLSKDADLAFELLADLVMRPLYEKERLEIERGRSIEGVRRRNDHPHAIASRAFREALYGPASPWARIPTQADIGAITREDLIALHRRFFTAGNARLVVVGDLDEAGLGERLSTWFGSWTGAAPARAAVDRSGRPDGPTRRLAVKKGLGQAVVLLGQRFLPRHHPDRYAADLLNYLLGGGVFQSRLGEAIRSDKGLAYSVSSGVRRLGDDDGYLYVFAGTKPQSQAEVMKLAGDVVERMHRSADVTEEELARAKDAFLNRHIFHFETAYRVAFKQALLDHYGYDPNWLRTYPERIAKVTVGDIARVARERLTPDRFATILVTPTSPAGDGWETIDLEAAVR